MTDPSQVDPSLNQPAPGDLTGSTNIGSVTPSAGVCPDGTIVPWNPDDPMSECPPAADGSTPTPTPVVAAPAASTGTPTKTLLVIGAGLVGAYLLWGKKKARSSQRGR